MTGVELKRICKKCRVKIENYREQNQKKLRMRRWEFEHIKTGDILYDGRKNPRKVVRASQSKEDKGRTTCITFLSRRSMNGKDTTYFYNDIKNNYSVKLNPYRT